MSDDSVLIRQSATWVSSLVAGRLRERSRPTSATTEDDAKAEPDRPALRAAEALVAGQRPAEGVEGGESVGELVYGPILVPDGLFADIEDRDEAKLILVRAMQARAATHVLLEGDPASGKSQLLQRVAGLPHTRYAVGGMTSSSGMIDYLLERRSTQIVVIDELDKAQTEDHAALYSLMESGTVPRLQHGKTEILHWRGRIFAACNHSDRLPEALVSRFVHVRLKPYSREQAQQITETILHKREGLSAARSKAIAQAVAQRSRDPRDGIQIGRLAGEDGDFQGLIDQVVAKSPEIG